ncbi:MAG: hypothetical protein ACREC4_08590 [Methylocella sp.]
MDFLVQLTIDMGEFLCQTFGATFKIVTMKIMAKLQQNRRAKPIDTRGRSPMRQFVADL